MKALILAAGYGSRLMPHTKFLPKPLFTLAGKPLLAIAVEKLVRAGCSHIFINTHHLAGQVSTYINKTNFSVPVTLVHEPDILGTGGAIASMVSVIKEKKEENFWVVNADVVSDICLSDVKIAHENSCALATLVLHDFPVHNKVVVDQQNRIINFTGTARPACQTLAFTGIQILSSRILEHFPQGKPCSSIDIFADLCSSGQIQAYVADHPYWRDTGTIETYRDTARQWLACKALGLDVEDMAAVQVEPICGDGSDRTWFRAYSHHPETSSVIIGDHGICVGRKSEKAQLKAFVHIGRHLHTKGIPVPDILAWDEVPGMVAAQDLGNCHLLHAAARTSSKDALEKLYEQVIDQAVDFSQKGMENFDPDWTYQTRSYSKEMILEYECRYFMEAFVNGYLGKKIDFHSLEQEFSHIADQALAFGFQGLIHRDLQSKNVMIHYGQVFFIDFQSARPGPFQYDLASLLIDPYVGLCPKMQQRLAEYAVNRLGIASSHEKTEFFHSYTYCALCRNLQFLGAFAFLSQGKGKKQFESYIPSGVHSLKYLVGQLEDASIPTLKTLVDSL